MVLFYPRKLNKVLNKLSGGLIKKTAYVFLGAALLPVVFFPVFNSDKKVMVVFVVDTLRKDTVESMPFLNGLREKSIRFTRAYSVSSWTPPSHASMFSGKLPFEHKTTAENIYYNYYETFASFFGTDWRKSAVSQNALIHPKYNFGKDFDAF